MTIKIGTKLPRYENRNGLHLLMRSLLHEPYKTHLAVVVLDTAKITRDLENDDEFPTVRIRAIEPITGGDVGRLRTILQRAYEERTGNVELPLDFESAFAEMASPRLPGSEPGR